MSDEALRELENNLVHDSEETDEGAENEQESGEEGSEGGKEIASETKKEIQNEVKRLKKLKLKFNGREIEEELPFEIDDNPANIEYMQRQLQMAKLGQQKSQDYSNLQKQVSAFVEELKKNPRKALANPNIGIDLKQLAAEILQEEIENSQKSPDQIKAEQLENKLREIEEERAREKEESQKVELERLTNQAYERYDMLMSKALDESDLPKSPYVVKKMADYMMLAIQNDLDVTPSDIVPIIKEEVLNDFKQMVGVMPAENLQAFFGKDVIDKVRKHNLAKVKKKQTSAALGKKDIDVGASKVAPKKKEDVKPQTFKDFFGV